MRAEVKVSARTLVILSLGRLSKYHFPRCRQLFRMQTSLVSS